MKIYSNGKDRVLTGNFPARFKLLNGEEEVPFIRTGKKSVRLSGTVPFGELDVQEVVVNKKPKEQPKQLDAMYLSIINRSDAEQLANAEKELGKTEKAIKEDIKELSKRNKELYDFESRNADFIDRTNGTLKELAKVFGKEIQSDRESIKVTARSIKQDIQDTALVINAEIEQHIKAKNPHNITKETVGLGKVDNTPDLDKPVSKATQKALDEKADKSAIEDLDKKIKDSDKKQDSIIRSIENANLYGGVGGNELPSGGKKGYVLTKASNKTGDVKWAENTSTGVHNDLSGRSAENAHPISAITGLQNALDGKATQNDIDTSISNHNTSELAHSYIRGLVSSEVTNRENADIGLQQQIDAITASSDVKDIVGTYAALQAYDTSTLGNNDIIKVLQDETQDDETTYYRWSTTTETFTLIGAEGPYYTKSEADATFVPQTRTVNGQALSSDITIDTIPSQTGQSGKFLTTNGSDASWGIATKVTIRRFS